MILYSTLLALEKEQIFEIEVMSTITAIVKFFFFASYNFFFQLFSDIFTLSFQIFIVF